MSTPSQPQQNPGAIAVSDGARTSKGHDLVLIDTAGRLHVDEPLMLELQAIKADTSPSEILLVADAMTGQDAVQVAQNFNEVLDLTGVILTKVEGDARGGAALSMRTVIDKPIKFLGVGEKLDALEVFHPDRLASRILGMGDVDPRLKRHKMFLIPIRPKSWSGSFGKRPSPWRIFGISCGR